MNNTQRNGCVFYAPSGIPNAVCSKDNIHDTVLETLMPQAVMGFVCSLDDITLSKKIKNEDDGAYTSVKKLNEALATFRSIFLVNIKCS